MVERELYIKPIRPSIQTAVLLYDKISSEITYATGNIDNKAQIADLEARIQALENASTCVDRH